MRISGWRARGVLGALSLLVVGALIGAVGHRFLLGHEGSRLVADMDEYRAAIPAFAEALELSDEQVAAVEAVLSRHQAIVTESWEALHRRLQAAADSAHHEIATFLNTEQRARFTEWLSRQHRSSSSPR